MTTALQGFVKSFASGDDETVAPQENRATD